MRAWRHHHQLTLSGAAERIGIDRNAMYRIEKGEAVNQETITTLWRWLLQ
jgi:transcriptional regulator with XRE-family HTH domain